jgi:hypothetical protein
VCAASGSAPDEQGAEGAATGGNGQRDDDAQVLGVAGNGAEPATQRSAAISAASLQALCELSSNSVFRGVADGGAPDGHGGEGATSGSALAMQGSRSAAADRTSGACRSGDTLEHQQQVALAAASGSNGGNASDAPSRASQLRLTSTALTRTPGVHHADERRHNAAIQLAASLLLRRHSPAKDQPAGGVQGGNLTTPTVEHLLAASALLHSQLAKAGKTASTPTTLGSASSRCSSRTHQGGRTTTATERRQRFDTFFGMFCFSRITGMDP